MEALIIRNKDAFLIRIIYSCIRLRFSNYKKIKEDTNCQYDMCINLKYFTFYPDFVEDIFKITRSDPSTWIGNINDSHCSCCKFSVNCKDGMQSITTTYLCFFAGTGSWLLVVS